MPTDSMPTPLQQQAAVARVAAVGVPIYRAGNQKRYVALTFDDGPGPGTAKVMDEMRKYGFRATFFTNGKNMDRWQDTLKRVARDQALGDHTWSHRYLPGLSAAAQAQEVSRSVRRSEQITQKAVMLFRPRARSSPTRPSRETTTTCVATWVGRGVARARVARLRRPPR